MRILNRVALVAAAFAPVMMLGAPANAAGAGAVVFTGDVTLATFPCPGGPGCTVTFCADVAAGVGITSGPGVGVVGGLCATVQYSEVCTAGEALTGSASGTATLTGTNVVGNVLPLTAPFSWTRVGVVAVITSNPLTNTAPAIAGAALFVPTGGLPVCTGGQLAAQVAGAAALVTTA